ncbi:MAG: lipid-A-disaccharide synthase [Gammaproteobacteria bacterium]|jgi:lipid-A-disaccharide synthase|nr:lipid-A-disaccharide synthase [Gammaproteobacteria bacterium]
MVKTPTFFLTACEPSGDRLGAAIIQAIKAKCPQANFVGVAGPLMRQAGCEALFMQESLAVMGITEVLKQLPRLLKARKNVVETVLNMNTHVLGSDSSSIIYIGIDAPDFNLYVEEKLKAHGIKTVHVNSPTVWAWRAGRIKKIKHAVDLMLVLFPFETKIYQENHIAVKYIGHPLADELPLEPAKTAARAALGIADNEKVLCLMPGSRGAEIKYLGPIFLQAAALCAEKIPGLKILAPMINEKRAAQFKSILPTAHSSTEQKWREAVNAAISIGNAHQVLQAADAVLITSGTATLEAMLCKTPMVIAYKTDLLTYLIARAMIKIPHVGLPNILAGKGIVPEILQAEATPKNLAQACLTLLEQKENMRQQEDFAELHRLLKKNAAQEAADAILNLAN